MKHNQEQKVLETKLEGNRPKICRKSLVKAPGPSDVNAVRSPFGAPWQSLRNFRHHGALGAFPPFFGDSLVFFGRQCDAQPLQTAGCKEMTVLLRDEFI